MSPGIVAACDTIQALEDSENARRELLDTISGLRCELTAQRLQLEQAERGRTRHLDASTVAQDLACELRRELEEQDGAGTQPRFPWEPAP